MSIGGCKLRVDLIDRSVDHTVFMLSIQSEVAAGLLLHWG